MRIATAHGYDKTMDNLNNRQAGLADLQEKLSAGKRVLRASDDPTAMAQAERAMNRMKRIETEQRMLSGQKNAMALAESTLGDSIGNLQAIRELVVAAGNGSYTTNDRTSLAQQMSALRDRLFNQSNAKDTNGIPLFGGLGSPYEAFSDTGGGVTFNGNPGQKSSSLTSIPGALDGSAIWNSLFTVLDNAINMVNNFPSTDILQKAALDRALSEIDQGMERLQSGRGKAGDMLNRADLIENNQIARSNQIQNDRSRAEDMDMVKGISDYQNQQTAYDAALKTYAQVQRLSLFNYMS
jgi:flagellar hook-associated protein 3 FlgL